MGKIGENLKPAFKIYKMGTTTEPITILIEEWRFTPEYIKFKIQKFNWLGYSVEMI
jgi:hypothetical protein